MLCYSKCGLNWCIWVCSCVLLVVLMWLLVCSVVLLLVSCVFLICYFVFLFCSWVLMCSGCLLRVLVRLSWVLSGFFWLFVSVSGLFRCVGVVWLLRVLGCSFCMWVLSCY